MSSSPVRSAATSAASCSTSWCSWLTDPGVVPADDRRLGAFVAKRIAKAQHTVLTDGRAITPASPAEALHDLRKSTKELRYLWSASAASSREARSRRSAAEVSAGQPGQLQDARSSGARSCCPPGELHVAALDVGTGALLAMGRVELPTSKPTPHRRPGGVRERFAASDNPGATVAGSPSHRSVARVPVLATYNIKGGVGKTAAASTSPTVGARGSRHLLWDLDPQGGRHLLLRVQAPRRKGGSASSCSGEAPSTRHQGHRPRPVGPAAGRLLLPAPGPRTSRAPKHPTRACRACSTRCAPSTTSSLLDCPPSISLATESVFDAADALLVPLMPATLASRTLSQLVDFLDDQVEALEFLPLLSMVDRRRKHHRELVEDLGKEWRELPRHGGPRRRSIERRASSVPVGVYASSTPATRAYRCCGPRSPPPRPA